MLQRVKWKFTISLTMCKTRGLLSKDVGYGVFDLHRDMIRAIRSTVALARRFELAHLVTRYVVDN
jgi:hypothetical protein